MAEARSTDASRMGETTIKLADLSRFLASKGFANDIEGRSDLCLTAVNTLEDARRGEISFLSNPRYLPLLAKTRASVVIAGRDVERPDGLTLLRCDDPYAVVTASIIRIHGHRRHPAWGIDARATIARSARIGEGAGIGPYVTIRENVTIGRNATLYPGVYVGDGVVMGDDVTLFPNVVVYDGVRVGSRVAIHAGSVIGEDGLGYAPVEGRWLKIPQIGSVTIEDDVEIGAGCAIDRATLGSTHIGRGSKFSNLVVVGHGAKVGQDCMIVAQVGIAGSSVLGDHVTLAGQVGVSGHLTIGDGARIGAQSGVRSNIEPGTEYSGSPAVPSPQFRRQTSLIRRLPQLRSRLRELELEVERLRRSMEERGERDE